MTRVCTVTLGDRRFVAAAGDRLLDAALVAGVDIAHDCRSGHCGSCLVRVISGHTLGGDSSSNDGLVHACQAHVLSDLAIAQEAMPSACIADGRVTAITPLAADIAEATIATDPAFAWLPGQYLNVRFAGYPWRAFSPTRPLDGRHAAGTLRLHIRRIAGGRVSSALGSGICAGHRVTIDGPHGAAFLRPGGHQRLVLFSGGTGFAPVWAIADAALREDATRRMVVVAGTRSVHDLYMLPALERMATCPNVAIVPMVGAAHSISPHLRVGTPADLASIIVDGDVVHAAGNPEMVATVGRQAMAAGAEFHADPFTAARSGPDGMLGRARAWLGASRITGPSTGARSMPAAAHRNR